MNIVKIIGLVVGIGLSSLASAAVVNELEDNQLEKTEHRFQILNGKSITMKSIFKIDLENGTVWRYRQGVDSKGKPFEEFFEVPNQ